MCPEVSLSCCSPEDQMVIYNKYVVSGKKEDIANQLSINQQILNKHLSLLILTQKISKFILKKQAY